MDGDRPRYNDRPRNNDRPRYGGDRDNYRPRYGDRDDYRPRYGDRDDRRPRYTRDEPREERREEERDGDRSRGFAERRPEVKTSVRAAVLMCRTKLANDNAFGALASDSDEEDLEVGARGRCEA